MHIKHNPITKVVLRPLIVTAEWYGKHYPLSYMKLRYFVKFHHSINLNNPQDLNEKIQWLSFYTDTTEWSKLSDKYEVRKFVKERGLENILIPHIGDKYYNVEDINFSSLPSSFVLKCNNGSGTLKIVRDKSKLDLDKTKKLMKSWLKYDEFGFEKHYRRIKNCIIIEELLPIEESSSSVVDYKMWCFHGHVYSCWVYTDRSSNGVSFMIYDKNWNPHPEQIITNNYFKKGEIQAKPENFEDMIQIAEILSKGFPEVRVDLYNIHGKIYFGEMTFTTTGGLMDFCTKQTFIDMGSQIDLNYK